MNPEVRSWGACLLDEGRVRFRIWAPSHELMQVRLIGRSELLPMQVAGEGWHELVTPCAAPGSRYFYVLPDGREIPDPASLFQPDGVAGPSEIVALEQFAWQASWQGRAWDETVILELHVGTFTPEGTFRAAIGKLQHLAALGITALELMPVAAFHGQRNWGYDGVLPYAPSENYGRPEDLQALVDAAHAAGLMVFQDVVYNHFGPEGNCLVACAPRFFTERHPTPWGAGFNFDGAQPVRRFFIDNALHWIGQYRMDGLRLDAVHAIIDDSPEHITESVARAVHERFPDRVVHLIVENDHNEARLLGRSPDRPWLYTAQCNDDIHHVLHSAATAEGSGYYADYVGDSRKLARAIAEGFAFQGEVMGYRGGPRGEPSAHLPPTSFISFIQSHDQVGNRALGERITALAPPAAQRSIAALYLLAPQIPMLFMGEEWGAVQPFPYFCDFPPELGRAIADGRRREFARFPGFADAEHAGIPDPGECSTFESAKLRWEDINEPAHAEMLAWYGELLSVRHREVVPRLAGIVRAGCWQVLPSGVVEVHWQAGDERLMLRANLQGEPAATADDAPEDSVVLWQEGHCAPGMLGPWSVEWRLHGQPESNRT